jgi:protein O-mannosyl-transferase
MSGNSKKSITKSRQKQNEASPAVRVEVARKFPGWLPVAVVLFTALLFSHSIFDLFVDWDDNSYIINNPYIRDYSLHGIKAIFTSFYFGVYHPLTSIVYLLIYTFFGLQSAPYHAVSLLFHLANTWLVFKVTEQLSNQKITSLVVCILFAIHPMHVESVAWASAMKDVVCGFFCLLALSHYLHYIDNGLRLKYYFLAMLFFLAALLSKSAAVPLSVLLFAIDIYRGRRINARLLWEKVPFLLLSFIFGIMNIEAQNTVSAINQHAADYGLINRVFLLTDAISFYIISSVLPLWLSPMHYFPIMNGTFLPVAYYASMLFILAIGWLITLRNSLHKEIVFGISFFLITISVMLQAVSPVGSHHVAERYTYLPYIGLFYIIGQWISLKAIKQWRSGIIIGGSIVVVFFSALTWQQTGIWKNYLTLFDDWMRKNPGRFAYGYWTRGNAEKESGDFQAALNDYDSAIMANPVAEDAYYNRAKTYEAMGQTSRAIQDYNKSIELLPSANAYNSRGWVYDQSGDKKAALLDYDKAILLAPKFTKPYFNRGAIEAASGNITAAIEDYNAVLKISPENKFAYYSRGQAYLMLHDTVNACKDWNQAKELGHEDAGHMIDQYCKNSP